ncbi:MAG: flippase-like domain-containing protein [Chloroflexi bacterium]|nr:flippase-like domain-containing protein [Chloroflexota bacterium]
MTHSQRFRLLAGLAIGLLAIWVAVHNVPIDELAIPVSKARFIWLVPAVGLQLLSIVARSWRWVVLLGKEERLAESFWAQGVGYLFTNVFPLRMGEPARVIAMSEGCGIPVVQVAASAIVERLLDVTTILLILALILPWMQVPATVVGVGLSLGVIVLLVPLMLLLALRFSQLGEKLLQSFCEYIKLLPARATISRWRELVAGLALLTHWRIAVRAIVWSLISWALSIGLYLCVLKAFRDDSVVVEAAFMVVALSLSVTVPSSPGFVGIFQLVGQQALVLPFGGKYDAASALAIALTAHVIYYLLTTALGVIGLWKMGRSFTNLRRVITMGRSSAR